MTKTTKKVPHPSGRLFRQTQSVRRSCCPAQIFLYISASMCYNIPKASNKVHVWNRPIIPQVLGTLAVVTFLASYQQKKRQNIILLNVISRVLYILQYCLLGAFCGAVLDVLGAVSYVIAQ